MNNIIFSEIIKIEGNSSENALKEYSERAGRGQSPEN